MTSKKLDELSKNLVGTKKISTDLQLWMDCSDGDIMAFEKMLEYNKGDIYDTLFNVYLRTCQYNVDRAVDLSNPNNNTPQCLATGQKLEKLEETYYNRRNGLEYSLYINPVNGIIYVNRYNNRSGKAKLNLIKQYK